MNNEYPVYSKLSQQKLSQLGEDNFDFEDDGSLEELNYEMGRDTTDVKNKYSKYTISNRELQDLEVEPED